MDSMRVYAQAVIAPLAGWLAPVEQVEDDDR